MALQYGLNNAVDFASSKIMMFASIYSRTMGQPMDKTQLWYPLDGKTAFERAKEYAASTSAYVGQEIAVVDVEYDTDGTTVKNTKAKIYVIQDAAGNLQELGQTSDLNALDARVQTIEEFFKTAEGETLDKALDTLIEIQKYVDEHGDEFFELRVDVDNIYQPWELNEDGSFKRDADGNRILAAKPTGALQDEIDRAIAAENVIYDADGKTVDGKPVATGLLPDEIAARQKAILDEATAREAADNVVYDADGGEDGEGNKIATGLLPEEIARATAAEKGINERISALFRTEGEGEEKEYKGEIVEYIADAIPIATAVRLGRVLSSDKENYVKVHETTGEMEVNSLNVMKLTQTAGDLLILDGGDANGIAG